jgi:hypothetical protein
MTKTKKEVFFSYVEVLNATEQLMVFTTVIDKKEYGAHLILNTALSIGMQDIHITNTINQVLALTKKSVKEIEWNKTLEK